MQIKILTLSRMANYNESYGFPAGVAELTIPRSKLGYHTNNVYPAFPPLMSDGRALVSNWQPSTETVANDALKHGITSNWEYRRYLTQHAQEIMQDNFLSSANDTGYMYPGPRASPDVSVVVGRDVSDLKSMYLTREQLAAQKQVFALPQS